MLPVAAMARLAGDAWAGLTPAQRRPYEAACAAAKAEYARLKALPPAQRAQEEAAAQLRARAAGGAASQAHVQAQAPAGSPPALPVAGSQADAAASAQQPAAQCAPQCTPATAAPGSMRSCGQLLKAAA